MSIAKRWWVYFGAIFGMVGFFMVLSPAADAATSEMVQIQGKVTNTDNTNVANGTYDFNLKIYNGAGSAATTLYTENWAGSGLWQGTSGAVTAGGESVTYTGDTNENTLKIGQTFWNTTKGEAVVVTSVNTSTNTVGISPTRVAWASGDIITNKIYVKDGVFTIALNSLNQDLSAVNFASGQLFLGITFNNDGEMKPRVQFKAVPYALNALSAQQVNGLAVTATNGTLTVVNGSTIQFGNSFSTGGNSITLNTTGTTNITLPTNGTLSTISGTETLTNKTIGSTGLVFSGATTDVDVALGEGLVLQGRADSSLQTTNGNITLAPAGAASAKVQIGTGGTGSATPDTLNLDVKNTAGDPATAENGAMYYNASSGKFRCYEAGSWADCIGTLQQAYNKDIDGSDAVVSLTSADGSFVIQNPATGGTTSGYAAKIDQLNTGNVVGVQVNNAGTGVLGLFQTTAGTTTTDGIVIQASNASGVITNAINVSDSKIVNALNIGANNIQTSATTIESTELDRLDGKDAPLVDANDFIIADGVGLTQSGSGLEADANGKIGLLQGCADGQVLKWNDASAIWQCGSDRATSQVSLTGNYTNNTTTLTNIDDDATATSNLAFSVGANETWIFYAFLQANSPTNADMQFQTNAPTGSTCQVGYDNQVAGESTANVACNAPSGLLSGTGTTDGYTIQGSIKTGATAGTVQLQSRKNTAAGGTFTIFSGSYILAYKVTGADLAEVYYTNDSDVIPGTLVTLDSSLPAGVKKTMTTYDNNMVGVVTTKPGLIMGDTEGVGKGKPVFIALTGRIPTRVSTQNGVINPGDYLTSSSTPGVAMKAKDGGQIIGMALTGYAGTGEGQIMMFLKNAYIAQPQLAAQPLSIAPESTVQPAVNEQKIEENVIDKVKNFIAQGLKVQGIAEFLDNVFFKGSVRYAQAPVYSNDSAGTAVVEVGDKSVQIVFAKAYAYTPVVTATEMFDLVGGEATDEASIMSTAEYAIVGVTKQGFTIQLKKPLTRKVQFAWNVAQVENPQEFGSRPSATPTPPATVTPQASPSATLISPSQSPSSTPVL